jgi:hypothetical protein
LYPVSKDTSVSVTSKTVTSSMVRGDKIGPTLVKLAFSETGTK